jgi:ClpP class serine protease
MSEGKKIWEKYKNLSREQKKELQVFLEENEDGDFYKLFYDFIKKYKN